MADKGVTIIIKKKKGGGHGHHGGAWKVAYADFATAMMAFFLVMWLLGADEETKDSIEQYFRNPSSPWDVNLISDDSTPLGSRTAAGDDVLKGQNGMVPEDLIEQPSEQLRQNVGTRDLQALSQEEDKVPEVDLDIEVLRFKLREDELFVGETLKISKTGRERLVKVAELMKTFKGKVVIKGFTDPAPSQHSKSVDAYEFATGRTVAIMNYFLENRIVDQSRIQTRIVNTYPRRRPASQFRGRIGTGDVRLIEVSFSKEN